jgi:PEP-CTERM motif
MGSLNVRRALAAVAMTICFFAIGGVAQAQLNLNYTVTPDDLVEAADFELGAPFGYDWDEGKPIGSTEPGAPGYGSGCFYSDVQGSAAGGGRDYTALRLSPMGIFGMAEMTIGNLDYISYFTKNNDLALIDWQMKIYTVHESSHSGWYGQRINFYRPDNVDNAWHLSSTDTNMTAEWIVDKDDGGANHYYNRGAYSTADLRADYGSSKIMFIDIIAGYATNSPPVDSYLDGIEIGLMNGDVASMNLEPVPEPSTWMLLGLGLTGLVAAGRKSRKN